MTKPVRLSISLLTRIMESTTYYDTLTIGTLNDITERVLKDQNFWKQKYLLEKVGLDKMIKVTNWHDFYLLNTDRFGGQIKGFDGLVDIIYEYSEVNWLITSKGLLYSTLRSDKDVLWTRSELSKSVKFLASSESNGHEVVVISEDNEVYMVKSANRSSRLIFTLEKGSIVEVLSDARGAITLLLNSGLLLTIAQKSSKTKEDTGSYLAILPSINQSGLQKITRIVQDRDGRYHYISAKNEEILLSGQQRIAHLAIQRPRKRLQQEELPESPVEVEALDTYSYLSPFNRAVGAEYDREEQQDIADEIVVSGLEFLEGSDVG